MADIDYPFCECDRHAGKQLGYAVCKHVACSGSPVFYVEAASPDSLGVILCAECYQNGPDTVTVEDLSLVCESCAKEHGIFVVGGVTSERLRDALRSQGEDTSYRA